MFQIVLPQENPPAITRPAQNQGAQVPAMPVPQSAMVPDTAGTAADLAGFRQVMEVQPVLEIHGVGTMRQAMDLEKGTLSIRQAFRQTLPDGWQVYAKPGVSLDLPIVVTGSMIHIPWTQTIKKEIQEAGLHGALWENQRILTVWAPPPHRVPVVASPTPDLAGFQKEVVTGSGVAPTGAVASPAPSLANATPVFLLNQGDLILTDLQKWAKQSGWTVVWHVPEDWQVPNTTTFSGDFQKAVTQVIQALSANGANVHAVFHTANNTVVISGAGGGE